MLKALLLSSNGGMHDDVSFLSMKKNATRFIAVGWHGCCTLHVGESMAADHHSMKKKPNLQLLGLLLLVLDLGLQRMSKGLRPCAVEGEFGLVLLLLGSGHLGN